MAGNVWEWCLTGYDKPEISEALPIVKGGQCVICGGSWGNEPEDFRASTRNWINADLRYSNIGFRLVQDIP